MPSKMSTSSQNNGKKSSNSSIVNTPSSTPVTNIANGTTQVSTQSSPPPNNNAPKYGTLVPNRIFVGGISANTTEGELMQLFSAYGTVKAAKIIQDRAGVSKGYGFITFESEDDAKRPLREAENIVLRERKLNIAPAIKKQPFSRAFDASSPPTVAAGNPTQFFFPPGAAVPYFQGGVAYYPQPAPAAPGDPSTQQPVYQPPPMYPTQTGPPQTAAYSPMMFPQTIYMPQQYPMPMPYDYNFYQGNGASPSAQYMAGAAQSGSAAAGPPQCSTMPPSNSPPRPPCYGQQMPAYNPGDPMLYNFPIYGSTLESLPIYTEAFDLGASGSYAEETIYNNLDRTVTPSHDDESTNLQTVSYCTTTTNNNNNTNGTAASEQQQQQQQQPHVSYAKDERNNARTPVVSLLSIDHQQEKDYSSMQSGRRRKPPPPQPPPPQLLNHNNVYHHHHHGYVSHSHPFVGFNPQQPPPTTNGYAPPPPPVFNDYHRRINGCFNNNNNNNAGKIVCGKNRGDDGKSSARTAVNTPPPAPYSPMANHQFKVFTNSNVKNFMNNNNSTKQNNNYARSGKKYGVSTTPPNTTTTTIVNDKTNNNNNNNSNSSSSNNLATPVSYSNNNRSLYNNHNSVNNVDSCSTSSTQVHLSTTTSQSFGPQTARRGKRSVRRGAGAVGGEIGAGDAPLPSDAGDVCKKLETIKL